MKRFLIAVLVFSGWLTMAQAQINLNAVNLVPRVDILLSPRTGSFVEGSTFAVPVLLNTKGASVNGIEVRINFDQKKLAIIQPASGTSIIGVWVEPPKYDNTRGTASYVGVVPGGIVSESGLVGTITFKVLQTGSAQISVSANSRILLNDGLGTAAALNLGRAEYTLLAKAPEGVRIFSETHPFQDNWSNNPNPILSWERDDGVEGFSFILDNKPATIPDNEIKTTETSQAFEKLSDGLWYFHIKARKNGVWGTTGEFLLRIDTTPPADFKPEVNYLMAATVFVERTLVSFFTTDNLSGLDHYEVGVIDKSQPVTESPVFVQAESPFQVPLVKNSNLQVVVRAIDKAGNVRDASITVRPPLVIGKFIKDYLIYILLFIIFAGLVALILHYLIGHHFLRYWRRASNLMEQEQESAKQGFSLIEILVTLGIFVLLIGVLMSFEQSVFRQNRLTQNDLIVDQDARSALRELTALLRAAAPSAGGAYPLAEATGNTLTFFSDGNQDGAPDQIRYFVLADELRRGMTEPTGSPPVYSTSSEEIITVARRLSPPDQAIFSYFDRNYTGTSTPLSLPIDLAAVRLVKVNLGIGDATYTTQVVMRSLKDNL